MRFLAECGPNFFVVNLTPHVSYPITTNEERKMRVLRSPEVVKRVGYSGQHIWRLEKAGKFPKRIRLGPQAVGWIESEINAWIKARIAERDAKLASEADEATGDQPDERPAA